MFKVLRIALLVGAVLVAVAAVIRLRSASAAAQAASAGPVFETATVDRGDVAIVVNATGTIQANQNVFLAFPSTGKVTSISVKPGDYVLKGQTLATIDNQAALDAVTSAQVKLNAQQIALDKVNAKPRQVDIDVLQAAVNVAKANLKESQSGGPSSNSIKAAQLNVEAAKNQLWQSELNRDLNNVDIANSNSSPQKAQLAAKVPSLENSIASADAAVTIAQDQLNSTTSKGSSAGGIMSAQASLTVAEAQLQALIGGPNPDDLKQAQANLASAQSALNQAQLALNQTNLMAPFDGVVAQVNLSVGQQAPATQAVILLDVSTFYVDLPVAELDIAKVKVGEDVNLFFGALPNATIHGKVAQIADIANPSTPLTYTVPVEIARVGQHLLSTMSTTASIITAQATNVVRLPNKFIRIDRTKNKAYTILKQPDGSFKEIEIQLGTASDTYTEIKKGVKEGDVVAAEQAGGLSGATGGGPRGRGPGVPI